MLLLILKKCFYALDKLSITAALNGNDNYNCTVIAVDDFYFKAYYFNKIIKEREGNILKKAKGSLFTDCPLLFSFSVLITAEKNIY